MQTTIFQPAASLLWHTAQIIGSCGEKSVNLSPRFGNMYDARESS